MSTGSALLLGLVLLAANGFFVAAEFALLAARRSRIEQLAAEGSRRARSASAGLRELSLMLAGAQLGITMASLGLGAVAEPAVAHLLEGALEPLGVPAAALHTIAFAIALSIVVFLHMVVGEMAPKSWAISHPERSALALAPFFRAYVLVFRPFIRFLNASANVVVRMLGVTPQDERAMAHSPADLNLLLEESGNEGTLGDAHALLLSRTLRLSEREAQAAMTPRWNVVSVGADATVDEVERTAAEAGLSRLLVCEGDVDHAIGVLHVRDAIVLDEPQRSTARARDLAQPVLATHEMHALDDLLADMRRIHRHFAVVVDELGVVSGIVTLEDIIEEIIGDFEDESDRPGHRIRRTGDGQWLVAGTVRPEELADVTGLQLPEGDWDTVAGYVIATLDRIPSVGDSARAPGLRLTVRSMDNFAVTEVAVQIDSGHDGHDGHDGHEGRPGRHPAADR
ncbi:MAG: hemolysin family protein [Actinomycetota bacterium]